MPHPLYFAALLSLLSVAGMAQVSTDPQPRKVLLEEFTAINCGNCPAGHATAASLVAANTGRVVLMHIHAGSLAVPSGSQPDLRTAWGTALASASGLSFTPQGMVSRKSYNGTTLLGAASWNAATNALLPQNAIVNIGLAVQYDPDTRLLTLDVEHYYTAASAGAPDRLHVVLSEDHITAYQANYGPGGAQQAYDHRYVVRTSLTPNAGDALGNGSQGEGGTNNISITLPMNWNAENVRIVAFVSEANGEVHNVAEAPVETGSNMIEEALEEAGFTLFPNPANDQVDVMLNEQVSGAVLLRDASGRLLHRFIAGPGQRQLLLNVAGFAEGLYLVSDERGRSARLIIQR
ncbi:MAG: Omp28-related outer membrane protein [Flavobacteriales bacterium]|nr:Omp28-related outer membrane protein [Flavobacteriales bacterium]